MRIARFVQRAAAAMALLAIPAFASVLAAPPEPAKAGPPELTAADFFKDFNALDGAGVMKKYKDGVIVSGKVLLTIKEMDGSHHVWLDATGVNYVSLSFADKGAAVVAKGVKKGDSVKAKCEVGGGIDRYIMVLRCELK